MSIYSIYMRDQLTADLVGPPRSLRSPGLRFISSSGTETETQPLSTTINNAQCWAGKGNAN